MVMAEIYVVCGSYEEAIDELDYFSSIESSDKINGLKFNPNFAPILAHPRYKELVERYNATWGESTVN
jgi:hypothetical protein